MKKIKIFYFSGTGNTYFVAKKMTEYFRKDNICDLFSIEKHMKDASGIIADADLVGIGYPIYGSSLPKIVKDFISSLDEIHIRAFIFCSQMMFSGDGAAYGGRLLEKKGFQVFWQEHFNMPNNITDVRFLTSKRQKNYLKIENRVTKKANKFAVKILSEKHFKKGSNFFSLLLGLSQRVAYEKIEENAYSNAIHIKEDLCNSCGLCTRICPSDNLTLSNGKVVSKGNCILCYRCVNHCPEKAMYIISKKGVNQPYHGPTKDFKVNLLLRDDLSK